MRITGGFLKGRQILFLKNSNIRPTTDKTRSAIFSILGDISGCNVLDICCGTGAFGIEAISRGAKSATFIDIHTDNLKKNLYLIDGKEFNVIKGDFTKKIPLLSNKLFDIIFIDPPYEKYDLKMIIDLISENNILSLSGTLIIEESKKINPVINHPSMELSDSRNYGDTSVTFYKLKI